jgi:hypothetical protein
MSRVRGTHPDSTNNLGNSLNNKHTGCIRTAHRAFSYLLVTEGILPVQAGCRFADKAGWTCIVCRKGLDLVRDLLRYTLCRIYDMMSRRQIAKKVKRTMRQGVDLGVFPFITVDTAKTGERVLPVNVHSTRTADTLSA